jgi:hypothetical protein
VRKRAYLSFACCGRRVSTVWLRPGSMTDRVQQGQRYLTPAPSATNNITFYVSQYFTDLHIPSIRFSAF